MKQAPHKRNDLPFLQERNIRFMNPSHHCFSGRCRKTVYSNDAQAAISKDNPASGIVNAQDIQSKQIIILSQVLWSEGSQCPRKFPAFRQ